MRSWIARGIVQRIMLGAGIMLASALIFAAPARTHEVPNTSVCEGFPVNQDAEYITAEREHPLELPVDWAGIAEISRDWIAVATEYHTTYCIHAQGMVRASDFERFGDRFIGFNWEGSETFGYKLIDRSGQGRVIDTAVRPHFSPEGNQFAVLNRTDTGMEEFDGFAIWHVYGGALTPYLVNSGPPLSPMIDWRIDRWDGENCLHISAVSYEQIDGNWDQLSKERRSSYVAHPANAWQITEGETCPGID